MTDQNDAEKKAAKQLRSQIMWAYVTGAISLASYFVRLEVTFVPLGFGLLGLVMCYQLMDKGEKQHAGLAAALNTLGIALWLVFNLAWLRRYFGI